MPIYDQEHLINGIRLYTVRAIEDILGHHKKGGGQQMNDILNTLSKKLDGRIWEITQLATQFSDLRKHLGHDGPDLEEYIRKTSHLKIPTNDQLKDFANSLDKLNNDKKHSHLGNYLHGYHIYLDPSAGQEEREMYGQTLTKISTRDSQVCREEYIARFGYLDFWPIILDKEVQKPEAFLLKNWTEKDVQDKNNYVKIPKAILALARLVSYETPLDNSRKLTYLAQANAMRKIVYNKRRELGI